MIASFRYLLPNFNPVEGELVNLDLEVRSVIILTQSCDLENEKAPLVAVCPVYQLGEWEEANPEFRAKGRRELVRHGGLKGCIFSRELPGPASIEIASP